MKKVLLVLVISLLLVGCDDSKEEASKDNRAFGEFTADLRWYKLAIAAEKAGSPWAGVDITPRWRQLDDPEWVNPNPPVNVVPNVINR